jgi:intracellular sulfur oxidation DsrE/DsrF family protein
MRPRLRSPWRAIVMTALLTVGLPCAGQGVAHKGNPVRAVYQIDGGDEQALRALRNIRNHLQADPSARITVVALGSGVDFLLNGEKDSGGYPFELIVQDLREQGVKFEVCVNTLDSRHLEKSQFIDGLTFVPSGFAELARLQFRQGFAYLKP